MRAPAASGGGRCRRSRSLEAAKGTRRGTHPPALRRRSIVGSPRTVREGLGTHAGAYGVDEVMAVTICYDFEKRKRSYELLAEEFGLAGVT